MRDEALARQLREAEENLRRALEALQAARDNTPEISAELQAAASQLAFMAEAARQLERTGATARSIEFIAKTGDHILEAMERAARLYEGVP
jgi:1,6-anhydro-N-acetylmuramate kinase